MEIELRAPSVDAVVKGLNETNVGTTIQRSGLASVGSRYDKIESNAQRFATCDLTQLLID